MITDLWAKESSHENLIGRLDDDIPIAPEAQYWLWEASPIVDELEVQRVLTLLQQQRAHMQDIPIPIALIYRQTIPKVQHVAAKREFLLEEWLDRIEFAVCCG